MIKVEIEYRNEYIVSFAVEGHAGFAPRGSDIYCAGVSAVTQTALLGLIKNLKIPPQWQVDNGRLECQLSRDLTPQDQDRAQIILSTMENGLMAMQEAYGEYLQIRVRRL